MICQAFHWGYGEDGCRVEIWSDLTELSLNSSPHTVFGRSAGMTLWQPSLEPLTQLPMTLPKLNEPQNELAASTVGLISPHAHWLWQPQNFLQCFSSKHHYFVFAIQRNKATIKSLPYSEQVICEQAEDKCFLSFSLKILAFNREGGKKHTKKLCY